MPHAPAPEDQRVVPVDEGVWVVDYPMVLAAGLRLPTRMTVVALGGGRLLCHSPVPLSAAAADQLRELGEVTVLVAPNCFHHLFIPELQRHAPEARLYGAPGLAAKRSDLRFDGELDDGDGDWRGVLERLPIDGAPVMNESVFFHPATATLLVADLVFNLLSPSGVTAHLGLRLMGVHGRLAQSRVWRFVLVKDRAAAAASCRELLAWPIERLVPCHGELEPASGRSPAVRDRLASALSWMLSG
ncbi:MAG: DUF4336 domain-containing protein [Acidobacteria bacterium]|nr:MAG: DUF4336 domain-containing protein [Acidobacteriota bacterium]REK08404.1 MAG: DUF4336 domain-containing protein [Acidobacteriota bacterium]